jgi:pyruvate/2-oxoglutarate dehydrogenase complex dihydrolipoamide dehydrogenase (E3) component
VVGHDAIAAGTAAAETIVGASPEAPSAVPAVVFTDPEIATVS